MTTLKPSYGASTSVTITAATLASSATVGRESASVNNASVLADDFIVQLRMTANGTPTANTFGYLFCAVSEDGTNYTDNATGADAALTLKSPTNLILIGQAAWAAASNYQVNLIVPSLVLRLGLLPRNLNFFVVQSSGVALSACAITYTPVNYTNV